MTHVIMFLLFIPCLLALNDVNPITGEWNPVINLIGFIYAIFYGMILKKIYANFIDRIKEDEFK